MTSPPRTLRAALLATLALSHACGGEPERPSPRVDAAPPPSVTVAPTLRTRLPDQRERVGQVRAVEDVELRARVSGFLEERRFEEGSLVAQGDLLFVIERAPYQAEVRRAEAELARTRAALQKAALDLRRTRGLREQGVASQAALDAAVSAEAEARAETLAADARLSQARLDLAYTEIHAPIAGRIGSAAYDVGDLVEPDSGPLATVVSMDPIHVTWQVPEQTILEFRRANLIRRQDRQPTLEVKASLRLADGEIYEYRGLWDFLDNRVDPTTGTQTARAVFPNPYGLLVPGQYAFVIVEVGEPRETLVVPQPAVQEDQSGRFVLVVGDGDEVAMRRVTMGSRQGIYWEVREGLSEGERVIYQGVQKARPGMKVDPVVHPPEPPVGS